MSATPSAAARRVVLVAGAGRSGTSTMSGLLRILGLHVPQPEIVADETNPKGFGEPRWVVDTHDRLLTSDAVQVADSRPQAWQATHESAADPVEQDRTSAWLASQLAGHPRLVVKDPRISWFLPMWRTAAQRNDAALGFVTMLRPPAEVVGSRQKYYNGLGPTHLAASWVNMLLHTELATRDVDGVGRTFVQYADLLADWRSATDRVDRALELGLDFGSDRVAEADGFVDPALRRVTPDLAQLGLPTRLHELVEATWVELDGLVEPDGDTPEAHQRLDALRASYAELYREAEELSASSVIAARREVRREMRARQARRAEERDYEPIPGGPGSRIDVIPHRVRAMIPAGARRRLRKALGRPR